MRRGAGATTRTAGSELWRGRYVISLTTLHTPASHSDLEPRYNRYVAWPRCTGIRRGCNLVFPKHLHFGGRVMHTVHSTTLPTFNAPVNVHSSCYTIHTGTCHCAIHYPAARSCMTLCPSLSLLSLTRSRQYIIIYTRHTHVWSELSTATVHTLV